MKLVFSAQAWDDYLYWQDATSGNIVRSPTSGPPGEHPDDSLHCNSEIQQFVTTRGALFATCKNAIWKMPLPPSSPRKVR